jgi:hypothetical protein
MDDDAVPRPSRGSGIRLAVAAWIVLLVAGIVAIKAAADYDPQKEIDSCFDVCLGPPPALVVDAALTLLTLVVGSLVLASVIRALGLRRNAHEPDAARRARVTLWLDACAFVALLAAWTALFVMA